MIPFIRDSRKTNLIYRDREQTSGCLGDLLQRDRKELFRVMGMLRILIVVMVSQLDTLGKSHRCVQFIVYNYTSK